MVRAVVLGDRDFVESYAPALQEPLIVTRAAWQGLRGSNIIELGTSYPPGASRSDVERDLEPRIRELAALAEPQVLLAELSSVEYTVLAPILVREWKPSVVLVEVSRLHPGTIAALKELSLLSHNTMIVGIYQRIAPRSRKLRPLFLDTTLGAPRSPGFYTFKLKRLKSYVRAWLWYYEAKDAISEARSGGVPDYLLIDLESKIAEAERLLRGSEFTIVFPGVYDIREPPPEELYKSAPPLLPVEKVSLYGSKCYASPEVISARLVTGCVEHDKLAEEAIYLWLVRAEPLPVWRGRLPGHLEETYASYQREARESPYKLHPKPPSAFNEHIDAPWHVIPLYSMDRQGMAIIAEALLEDLAPLRVLASVAAQCTDEHRCTQASLTAGQTLLEAVRSIVARMEDSRALVSLYRSVRRALGEPARLAPEGVTPEELQENLALLAWILQDTLGLDPETADTLSLYASEITSLLL